MYKICTITGTRADYGLLKELLLRFQQNPQIELDLVVTGTHLSKQFGNTQDEIANDGFDKYNTVSIPVDEDTKQAMASSTGTALIIFSKYFAEKKPDILVVLGDRFEILAAVIAAQFLGIPIAHISGGDVTEGAIDDAIRHSITKMSQLHFPGCEQSAKRIIQMGEQPQSVFMVGEPGVENCLKMSFLSPNELAATFQFKGFLRNYCVITYHPVTRKGKNGFEDIIELTKALDAFHDIAFVITLSNADAGGREINRYWMKECPKRDNWCVIPSMGVQRYLSALKHSKVVIGNSSSGIVEAPVLGIPTVNIGDRQKGRMMAKSIICCKPNTRDIINAMEKALSDKFQLQSQNIRSPFGDGTTSEKIEYYLIKCLQAGQLSLEKQFYDIEITDSVTGDDSNDKA